MIVTPAVESDEIKDADRKKIKKDNKRKVGCDMSEYKVSIRTLKAKAEELTQLNAMLNNMISSLQETELSLCGMWEGPANRAFHEAFMHDIWQLRNFYNTIRAYIIMMYAAINRYTRAEHWNVRIACERTYNGSPHGTFCGSDYCEPAPDVKPNNVTPIDFEPESREL